jgi:hypothetical protein
MTQEELRLEIVKTLFPVYKDIMSFKRVANDIYNWIAPEGLKNQNEKCIKESIPEGFKKGPGGRLYPIEK